MSLIIRLTITQSTKIRNFMQQLKRKRKSEIKQEHELMSLMNEVHILWGFKCKRYFIQNRAWI